MKYVVALDQGTTSSRTVIFDETMQVVSQHSIETTQHYPQAGYVEHDPMEILATQLDSMRTAMDKANLNYTDVAAIGITNQRETAIVWDKATGEPIHPAIVWQCRRTASICEELKAQGLSNYIRETTGLVVDAYFSGTKVKWILDHVDGARERAQRGELLFGTVDSWLVWNLTKGRVHVTDVTNASRTMLYDIHKLRYDDTILNALGVPAAMLPEVKDSSAVYGHYEIDGHRIPIAGIAGDQQASLFGHSCFEEGQAKNTYGTGCFLLMNTGGVAHSSQAGLITTIAVGLNGKVQYALEGSVFVAGAIVQWLRDELGLITDSAHMSRIAASVPDTGGVYLVPAFTGLGAPYWDMYARGCLVGLTRGTNKAQIVRAANESIAYGVYDLVQAMRRDSGIPLTVLNADGGACRDEFLMQFQADILDLPVQRTAVLETTALGAAWLAGLAVGVYDRHSGKQAKGTRFEPHMDEATRRALCTGWERAVERSRAWEEA